VDTVARHRWIGPLSLPRAAIAWRAIVVGLGLALLCSSVPAAAAVEPEQNMERSVKAAFLYKFLNFANWPVTSFADADAPFVIGIFGSEAMASAVAKLVADHPVSGRAIEVRTMKRGDSLAGLHVLFVARPETSHLATLSQQAQQQSVLLVSESDRGLSQGSAINLVVVDGRIRFDVALDAAEKSGVRLSSRLLAVARSVRTGSD
jgi:YfiR/HmsC-like